MKCLIITVILCFILFDYLVDGQRHDLYYGRCSYSNNSEPIYSQVISIRNMQSSNNHQYFRPTRWFDSMRRYFTFPRFGLGNRAPTTTTPTPPHTPIVPRIITTRFRFPPNVNQI